MGIPIWLRIVAWCLRIVKEIKSFVIKDKHVGFPNITEIPDLVKSGVRSVDVGALIDLDP